MYICDCDHYRPAPGPSGDCLCGHPNIDHAEDGDRICLATGSL